MSDQSCGLDFGTSNSTLSVMRGNRPFLVPLEGGRPTLPSAIFFNVEDRKTYLGKAALDEHVSGAEGRLMRSLKSVLGTSLMSEATKVGRRSLPFSDVIAAFLRHMKKTAEDSLGEKLKHVVVGRPVFFVDDDPLADAKAQAQLRDIVSSVGFERVEFQYEPIAAAYEFDRDRTRTGELSLVVDIGGGTSDFSVVRSPSRDGGSADDILATYGVHIGGNNLDRILALEELMPLLGYRTDLRDGKPVPSWPFHDLSTWHRVNTLYTHKVRTLVSQLAQEAARPDLLARLVEVLAQKNGHYLLARAEALKLALSDEEIAVMKFNIDRSEYAVEVSRAKFAEMIGESLQALRNAVAKTLDLAGLPVAQVRSVFLTGGTTLSPTVRALFRGMFPDSETILGDSFGSVGSGLAIDAARRFRS